jgi:hypothetical protein
MRFISAFFPSGARTKYFERNAYPYVACYLPHPYYHLFVYPNIAKKRCGSAAARLLVFGFESRRVMDVYPL